jgi:hypothetical protein
MAMLANRPFGRSRYTPARTRSSRRMLTFITGAVLARVTSGNGRLGVVRLAGREGLVCAVASR